jgi:class 3 adenylate cyclase
MPALSDRLGRQLLVHVGLACGEVVASGTGSQLHREYTVTGDSVNLAARFVAAAAPGTGENCNSSADLHNRPRAFRPKIF